MAMSNGGGDGLFGSASAHLCSPSLPFVTAVTAIDSSNQISLTQMESILRQCLVRSPKQYAKADDQDDDVFLCEYEYNIHWHSFRRLAEVDKEEEDGVEDDSDQDCVSRSEVDSETNEDMDYEEERTIKIINGS